MVNMFKWLGRLLSPYADPVEKQLVRFVRMTRESVPQAVVAKRLAKLMQTDLAVVTLWLEANYKGYKRLGKARRRKLYGHAREILARFQQYAEHHPVDQELLLRKVRKYNVKFTEAQMERLGYLQQIMAFLLPGIHYQYQEAASFARLLVDLPGGEQMIGDCNQIVTFYCYLYASKFDLTDLQIKLVPGHVCLHYQGVDIEATNGTFKKYEQNDGVFEITELVSTNLLDVSDASQAQKKISERAVLAAARLAERISSNREVVEHNLKAAYFNLALLMQKRNRFKQALFFAEKVKQTELIDSVKAAAVKYFVERDQFSKAESYANADLLEYVQSQEAHYWFEKDKFAKARRLYKALGNKEAVKATYGAEFNQLREKVANDSTLAQQKKHRTIYKQMLRIARKLDDQKLAKQLGKVVKSIS